MARTDEYPRKQRPKCAVKWKTQGTEQTGQVRVYKYNVSERIYKKAETVFASEMGAWTTSSLKMDELLFNF